jgi:hypothetical protein
MQGFTENTPRADEIVQGKSRLSVPPVDIYDPIAVGDNDPRLNQINNNLPSYFTGQAFAIWTGTGLIFDVIWTAPYFLNNVQYPAGTGQITLDPSDPTFPRFDAIIVDQFGANFITGTSSADPVFPTIDPLTQLLVTYVSIPAGATTPGGVTEEVVYNENVEWTGTSNNGTVTFTATGPSFTGTYFIQSGAFNNSHYIRFSTLTTQSITSYNLLKFYIRLNSTWSISTYIQVQLFNDSTFISNKVPIVHDGSEGFDRTNTAGYQIIVVPISSFTVTSSNFNRIEFTFAGSNSSGFSFDYVVLQGGLGSSSPIPNFFGTILDNDGNAIVPTQPNDTLTIKGSTKTGDKELTVDSGGGGLEPYVDLASFPLTGSDGITYVAEDTGFIYYWDGSAYVQIGGGGIPGHEIIDEDDNPLPQQPNLKFERLIVTDDIPNTQTIVTRPADTFVGTTAPSSPVEGDVWTDTNDTVWKTYVWYDGYWVEKHNEGSSISVIDYSQYAKIQAIWYHLNSF